ncbi:MAG: hypothetical protein ACYDGM_06160, partial [Vulcanimicrobiaceae bacterium]
MRTVIDRGFQDLSRADRSTLQSIALVGFSDTSVAGVVLGLDLWRDELLEWRDRFASAAVRPPLWSFAFGASASWETKRWRSLPTQTRIFRAEVGALAHDVPSAALIRADP